MFEKPFLSWGGIKICRCIQCLLIQSRGLETAKVRLLFQLESGFCPKKWWENVSVRRQRGFPGRKYKSCLYGFQHLITKPRARLERASDKAFLLEENQQERANYRNKSGRTSWTSFKIIYNVSPLWKKPFYLRTLCNAGIASNLVTLPAKQWRRWGVNPLKTKRLLQT